MTNELRQDKVTSPKVLVTGGNGLVGRALRSTQPDHILDAIYTTRSSGSRPLDICDQWAVKALLDEIKPDLIIHTAAMTSVDAAEADPESCWKINVDATQTLAEWSRDNACRLVHFSTDFVFDGEEGMYKETDVPRPISVYGRSKLASENAVTDTCPDFLIIRTVLVYGHVPGAPRPTFPDLVTGALRSGKTFRATGDQFRTPTCVWDLASATWQLALGEWTGIVHLSGPEYLSIYDFAVRIADHFGLDSRWVENHSTASQHQRGPRPLKTGFSIEKARALMGYAPRGIDAGLESMDL